MGRRRRRRPSHLQEMEVDEVRLTPHWTAKVTTPREGELKLYFLMEGLAGCSIHLIPGEVPGICEGLRATAEALEEAYKVDKPVQVRGDHWLEEVCADDALELQTERKRAEHLAMLEATSSEEDSDG